MANTNLKLTYDAPTPSSSSTADPEEQWGPGIEKRADKWCNDEGNLKIGEGVVWRLHKLLGGKDAWYDVAKDYTLYRT